MLISDGKKIFLIAMLLTILINLTGCGKGKNKSVLEDIKKLIQESKTTNEKDTIYYDSGANNQFIMQAKTEPSLRIVYSITEEIFNSMKEQDVDQTYDLPHKSIYFGSYVIRYQGDCELYKIEEDGTETLIKPAYQPDATISEEIWVLMQNILSQGNPDITTIGYRDVSIMPDTRNLKSYVDEGLNILESPKDVIGKTGREVKAAIEEAGTDLLIYCSLTRSVNAINIYSPTGELYGCVKYINFDDPYIIEDAQTGEWTIEYVPSEENKKYLTNVETIMAIRPSNNFEDITTVWANSLSGKNLIKIINDKFNKIGKNRKIVLRRIDTDEKVYFDKPIAKFSKEFLNKGEHMFALSVADDMSYSTESMVHVYYDPDPPVISINDYCSNNTVVIGDPLFGISGTIDEIAYVTINGEEVGSDEFEYPTTYFGRDVELKLGANKFKIVATDRVGNVSTKKLVIYYKNK